MSRSMLSNIPTNRSVNDDFQEISGQSRGSWLKLLIPSAGMVSGNQKQKGEKS
jgi:hypothetical protein